MSFSRPVVAFALLKQSGEAIQGDLLSGITILLRPLVADLSGRVFDSTLLATRMAQSYGMDFPASVLEDFVPRLLAVNGDQEPRLFGGEDAALHSRVLHAMVG